jgi:hypothetical protein
MWFTLYFSLKIARVSSGMFASVGSPMALTLFLRNQPLISIRLVCIFVCVKIELFFGCDIL